MDIAIKILHNSNSCEYGKVLSVLSNKLLYSSSNLMNQCLIQFYSLAYRPIGLTEG